GGDQYGHRYVGPEHRRRRLYRRDVHEHAGPQLAPLEGGEIVTERDLVTGPAGEVRVGVRVELVLGESLVVPDVDRFGHAASLNRPKRKPASGGRRRVSGCRGA